MSGSNIFILIGFLVFLSACSPKVIVPAKQPTTKPPVTQQTEDKKASDLKKTTDLNKSPVGAKVQMLISLILPFNLDKIYHKTASAQQISKVSMPLDYYQGFKMALDSVAVLYGGSFKLQVYDNGDEAIKTNLLTLKATIKNSDLIVGPIYPDNLKEFSRLSKALKIPLVSPLAPTTPAVFGNPYLIMMNVTIQQHAYVAASFIKENLRPKKVLSIRSGQAEEYKYANPFKKGMDSLAKGVAFAEIGIKSVGYGNVVKYLNPNGLNVIVLPSTDRLFLESIFKVLDKLSETYEISIIGHPNWGKAQFLNVRTLEKLNTYITSSYQVDYKSSEVISFVKNYRNKYEIEPSEYSFKGFDTGFYLASLMVKKGRKFFSAVNEELYIGLHNNFNFIKDAQFGYFNNEVTVLKYQDFELVKSN